MLCFDQTINKIPGLVFSFSVKYAGTSLERHACHKFRTQEHIIDLINRSIFSLLTLFVLVHISILIVNIVFVLLDMWFDSNKSEYTCYKLSPQFFQNGTKNTNTILTYSECTEMLSPVNLHDSNVKFNCLMAVIIIVSYMVGICCHFPNQSKEIFIIAVRKLVVFLQTVNELWIFNGRFSLLSLESLVHVVKLVVTVFFGKQKHFCSCQQVSVLVVWECQTV